MKTPTALALCASTLLLASPAMFAGTASENWTQSCASCHGADGVGLTKMGKKLGVKDLTDSAYQKSFTDAQLFDHLKSGETGTDGKVKMKAFGEKFSDDDIKALVGYVRSLSK